MVRGIFKGALAEGLGVFFLVLAGGGAICMNSYLTSEMGQPGFGLLGIALAHGLALMVAIYMAAGVSGGHINPAVSLALAVIGKCEWRRAWAYVFMQLVGAVVAGIGLWAMFSEYRIVSPYLGTPSYNDNPALPGAMSMPKAAGVEALLTFLLMSTILMTAVDGARRARQMFGIAIGMCLVFCILIGGPYTGAALNPARYFGPAVVSGQVSQLVVYFVGPLAGALLAAIVYRLMLETKEDEAEAA